MRYLSLPLLLLCAACQTPDPKKELSFSDFEGYWIVDTPLNGAARLAPTVRLKLVNLSARRPIQFQATFRRKGEEQLEWGNAWVRVSSATQPLAQGAEQIVVLASDSHYTTLGSAEAMLNHAQFKDARADVFVKVGPSPWTKVGSVEIERRIGTQSLPADQQP